MIWVFIIISYATILGIIYFRNIQQAWTSLKWFLVPNAILMHLNDPQPKIGSSSLFAKYLLWNLILVAVTFLALLYFDIDL